MFSLQAKRTAFNYSNRASSQMLTRTALMAPSVTASSTPVDFQKRQFYGMIYKLMKQKNQNENQVNTVEVDKEISEDPSSFNMKAARDKYVQEQTRELMFTMKQDTIPKGVIFSNLIMSTPLLVISAYLGLLAPMAANPAFVDPVQFAYLARSAVRLLSLNIAFIGGIHYGLASAIYETAINEEELKAIRYQMVYAFVPAAMAFSSTSFLLFASPLTVKHIVFSFTSLMLTQLITMQVDIKCVEKELAPKWFLKFRTIMFSLYMMLTVSLFSIYYYRSDLLQRKRDVNRIATIKSALELEDQDFIEMVNELKIDYDEADLREVERQFSTRMAKSQAKI